MTQKTERITTTVSSDLKEEVEREAIERSEPGDRTTVSDVIRSALYDHFDESAEN